MVSPRLVAVELIEGSLEILQLALARFPRMSRPGCFRQVLVYESWGLRSCFEEELCVSAGVS